MIGCGGDSRNDSTCFVFLQSVISIESDGVLGCLQPVIAEAAALHVASCVLSWLTSLLNPRALLSVRDVELKQGQSPRTLLNHATQSEMAENLPRCWF